MSCDKINNCVLWMCLFATISISGCGDGAQKNPAGIEISLKFAKNDPKSLSQATETASAKLQTHVAELNTILTKMGVPTKLESLRLTTKPDFVVIEDLGKDKKTNFDLNLFRTIDVVADVKRYSPKRPGWSPAHTDTLMHRKLLWPDLNEDTIQVLKTQHNDLVFAETPQTEVPAKWVIRTSYRELLAREFLAQAVYVYQDENKTGKLLYKKLSQSVSPTKEAYCKEVSDLVDQFIKENFSDLGAPKDIKCLVEERGEKFQLPELKIDTVIKKPLYKLSFNCGAKSFSFERAEIAQALFPLMVQELLLAKFDAMFSGE